MAWNAPAAKRLLDNLTSYTGLQNTDAPRTDHVWPVDFVLARDLSAW